MKVRVRLNKFSNGSDIVVIVKCSDDTGQVRGKYVVGRHRTEANILALVLDANIQVHPAIVRRYGLLPLGGEHFVIDHRDRSIRLNGKSETYGAESDRELTSRALTAALVKYRTIIE